MADWKTVESDGFPQCDGHTTFIGINSAGYACCFNAMRGGLCVMETAEGNYRQMSDLRDWRLLDRPARGVSRPDDQTKPPSGTDAAPPVSEPAVQALTDEQIRSLWQTTDTGDIEDDIMSFAHSIQEWQTALPDMRDAYVGAREDLLDWKRRALTAEAALREEQATTKNLVRALREEIDPPAFMGEPVVQVDAPMPPADHTYNFEPLWGQTKLEAFAREAVLADRRQRAAQPTELQAIELLVSALSASRGWLRDYSRSIILDAIERKTPVPAVLPLLPEDREVLEKDAERYRWLRERLGVRPQMNGVGVMKDGLWVRHGCTFFDAEIVRYESNPGKMAKELDSAIDSAMSPPLVGGNE